MQVIFKFSIIFIGITCNILINVSNIKDLINKCHFPILFCSGAFIFQVKTGWAWHQEAEFRKQTILVLFTISYVHILCFPTVYQFAVNAKCEFPLNGNWYQSQVD